MCLWRRGGGKPIWELLLIDASDWLTSDDLHIFSWIMQKLCHYSVCVHMTVCRSCNESNSQFSTIFNENLNQLHVMLIEY